MATSAVTVGTVIGKGLLASAIGDLYLFIKSSTHNEKLEQVLCELDIKAELDVVQALLYDLAAHTECRVVKVSSDQVRDSINLIHDELKVIQKELEDHKTRYFSNWRSPNYGKSITTLRAHREILKQRRELLVSVLGVQSSLTSSNKKSGSFFKPLLRPMSVPAVLETVDETEHEPVECDELVEKPAQVSNPVKKKNRVKSFFENLLESSKITEGFDDVETRVVDFQEPF